MKLKFSSSLLILSLIQVIFTSCSPQKEFSIEGTVQKTEMGKDGYTAVMRDDEGNDFDAVFSRVTLGDKYRVFVVGERLRVSGDTLHLDNKLRVIVKKINE